jgi:hypothetical protein
MDYLVNLHFKHINKIKTQLGIEAIHAELNYPTPIICTPMELVEMEVEEQTFETWLHEVRIQIYEDTKDMSKEEYGKMMRAKSRKAAEKYGFQLVDRVPPRSAKHSV